MQSGPDSAWSYVEEDKMEDQIEKLTIMGAGRLLKGFLLVVGAVAWASLVPPLMADEIFPSDGHAPQKADAELLEAVCPGQVDGTSCRVCPEFTFNAGDTDPSSVGVIRGHFLSPTSEDATLYMGGCESHQENYGGTLLLTQRSQQWKMLWYKAGVITSRCHKVPLRDRREILVCMDSWSITGGGLVGTTLYTQDPLQPRRVGDFGVTEGFFVLKETAYCCSNYDPSVGELFSWGSIERVDFGKNIAGGPPTISVTANFGEGAWTAETIQHRSAVALERAAPLKRYRIDFVFDGQDYKPTPASAATAKIFADQR
jgi:hypothetical protein